MRRFRKTMKTTLPSFSIFLVSLMLGCSGGNDGYLGKYYNQSGGYIEFLDNGHYILHNKGMTLKSADLCNGEEGYAMGYGDLWPDIRDKKSRQILTEAGMNLSDSTEFRLGRMNFCDGSASRFIVSGGALYFKNGSEIWKK